eukprot:jgi/Mesvir1/26384/Mv16848-RA.1
MGRKIIIAIDHCEASKYAFTWAEENLMKDQDTVVLVHCHPIQPLCYYGGFDGVSIPVPVEITASLEKAAVDNARKLTADLAGRLKARSLEYVIELVKGDARESLVDAVERHNADMLVMGSRGLGAIKRTLIGSVSDFCIHHVDCPVVVVKMP